MNNPSCTMHYGPGVLGPGSSVLVFALAPPDIEVGQAPLAYVSTPGL